MIDEKDMERLKEVFVTRRECDERTDKISGEVQKIDVRIARIEENQSSQGWLLKTILAASITSIIGTIISLIVR